MTVYHAFITIEHKYSDEVRGGGFLFNDEDSKKYFAIRLEDGYFVKGFPLKSIEWIDRSTKRLIAVLNEVTVKIVWGLPADITLDGWLAEAMSAFNQVELLNEKLGEPDLTKVFTVM